MSKKQSAVLWFAKAGSMQKPGEAGYRQMPDESTLGKRGSISGLTKAGISRKLSTGSMMASDPAKKMFLQAAGEGSVSSMRLALDSIKYGDGGGNLGKGLVNQAIAQVSSSHARMAASSALGMGISRVSRDDKRRLFSSDKTAHEVMSFLLYTDRTTQYNSLMSASMFAHVDVVAFCVNLASAFISYSMKRKDPDLTNATKMYVRKLLGIDLGTIQKQKGWHFHTPLTLAASYDGKEYDAHARALQCAVKIMTLCDSPNINKLFHTDASNSDPPPERSDFGRVEWENRYLQTLWKFVLDFPASLVATRRSPDSNTWSPPLYPHCRSILGCTRGTDILFSYEDTLLKGTEETELPGHPRHNHVNLHRRTALMHFSSTGNVAGVKQMMKRGLFMMFGNLDCQDIGGRTALMLASYSKNPIEICRTLFEERDWRIQTTNPEDVRWPNPLIFDDEQKYVYCQVAKLNKGSPSAFLIERLSRCTLSYFVHDPASFFYVLLKAEHILRNQAGCENVIPFSYDHAQIHRRSLNVEDIHGNTVLMLAMKKGAIETVDICLKRDIDICNPTHITLSKKTALMAGAEFCQPKAIARLLQDPRVSFSWIKSVDLYGLSALLYAASASFGAAAQNLQIGMDIEEAEAEFERRQFESVDLIVNELEKYHKPGQPLDGAVQAFLFVARVAQRNANLKLLPRLGVHPLQPVPEIWEFCNKIQKMEKGPERGFSGRAYALMETTIAAKRAMASETPADKIRESSRESNGMMMLAHVYRSHRLVKTIQRTRLFGRVFTHGMFLSKIEKDISSDDERNKILGDATEALNHWPGSPKFYEVIDSQKSGTFTGGDQSNHDFSRLTRGAVALAEALHYDEFTRAIGRLKQLRSCANDQFFERNLAQVSWTPAVVLVMSRPDIIETAYGITPKTELIGPMLDAMIYVGHRGRIYVPPNRAASEMRQYKGVAVQLIPPKFSKCQFKTYCQGERLQYRNDSSIVGQVLDLLNRRTSPMLSSTYNAERANDVKDVLVNIFGSQIPEIISHKSIRSISTVLSINFLRRKILQKMMIYLSLVFFYTLSCFAHSNMMVELMGVSLNITLGMICAFIVICLVCFYAGDEIRHVVSISRALPANNYQSQLLRYLNGAFGYLKSFWNLLDILTICVIFGCSVPVVIRFISYHRSNDYSQDEDAHATWRQAAAIGLVLQWVAILQFSMQFTSQSWGLFTNIIVAMLTSVRVFMVILFLFTFAFGAAFHVVLRGTNGNVTLFDSVVSQYRLLLGDFDYDGIAVNGGWVGIALFLTSAFFGPILMLNFLVALMATTYETVIEAADLHMALKEAETLRDQMMLGNHEGLCSVFGPDLDLPVLSMVTERQDDHELLSAQLLERVDALHDMVEKLKNR